MFHLQTTVVWCASEFGQSFVRPILFQEKGHSEITVDKSLIARTIQDIFRLYIPMNQAQGMHHCQSL